MAATKLAKDSMQVFTALVAWSTDKDGALPDSLDELVTATLVEAPFLEGYKKHLIEYSGKGHAISDEGTLVVLRAKASADSKLEAVTLLNGSTKTEPARP